ncbi:IRK-interacting protein [Spatholobus suberectus]|nr:IRK-interacting protein [Spatholobus suberectus]
MFDLVSIINSLTPLHGPPQLPPSSFLFFRFSSFSLTQTPMTRKVSNFSDLIQRVATSCLLHPLADDDREEECHGDSLGNKHDDEDEDANEGYYGEEKVVGLMRALMEEVFEAVSAMKSAYASFQEAHCPWDPQKMREADVAVVVELKKLAALRDRFHCVDGKGRRRGGHAEVVAPYETVMKGLKKKEVKAKDFQVQNLKEKLERVATLSSTGTDENKPRRPQPHTKRKLGCNSQIQGFAAAASPELFEATMVQVKEASKSFTSLLWSLMHDANWDMAAAVRSIEATTDKYYNTCSAGTTSTSTTTVSNLHAKYAIESYVFRKMFQGFDHESFYTDGSLSSSLLNPSQFRRECFSQYRDMKSTTDPSELLGILPTCRFGKFCANKYLAIVHPKMEESLFGDLEQHSVVCAGNHPRTRFYNEFLGVAKGVWLLHLLAFSLDPAPSRFQASGGEEFHPRYMDSVVKFAGGSGKVVGFSVSPGFKLANGSVMKARVYLMARK